MPCAVVPVIELKGTGKTVKIGGGMTPVLVGERINPTNRKDLIAKLKDAGVVVIPSIGARRHAEKVAQWGVDAVLVQGGEGGGHTGAVPLRRPRTTERYAPAAPTPCSMFRLRLTRDG